MAEGKILGSVIQEMAEVKTKSSLIMIGYAKSVAMWISHSERNAIDVVSQKAVTQTEIDHLTAITTKLETGQLAQIIIANFEKPEVNLLIMPTIEDLSRKMPAHAGKIAMIK